MRVMRIAVIALLGLPLAGCFGVTLPPKELPAWAMSPQAEAVVPTRVRTARSVPTQRAANRTASISSVAPRNTQSADVKPFSPEWQVREDAFDNKLRRTMNICRAC